MPNPNHPQAADLDRPNEAPELPRPTWHTEAGLLLAQAARLCVQHGLDVENFMNGAWSAYVEARPGFREHLEEMQLRDQLEEIRKLGRMGEA